MRQAAKWNRLLQERPLDGSDAEFVVRVSDRKDDDGTWKLVWHHVDTDKEAADEARRSDGRTARRRFIFWRSSRR